MVNSIIQATIKLRRDFSANWTSNNPILSLGEFGIEIDTLKLKIGDGATNWNSLEYPTYSKQEIDDIISSVDGGSTTLSIGSPVLSSTPGSILYTNSSGNLTQDNSKLYYDSTKGTLKLIDKNYVPFAGSLDAETLFSVGSNDNIQNNTGVITTSNHWVSVSNDIKLDANGVGKWYIGQLVSLRVGGTGYSGSGQIIGTFVTVNNRGNLTATPYVYGIQSSINLEGHATESVSIQASSFRGSAVNCPKFVGIRATAANSYSNADEITAGEFWNREINPSFGPTTTLSRGVWSHLTNISPHTITTARGVDISGWVNTGTTTNSVGLYIDNSVDIGTTSKYAIKSESTSPSSFIGKLGIGSGTETPAAKLHIRDTLEQVRLSYDSSSYTSMTVDSDGSLSFASTGLKYVFDNNIEIGGNVIVSSESYSSAWNGSLSAPTKNDVYDKIESLTISGADVSGTLPTTGAFTPGDLHGLTDGRLFYSPITNEWAEVLVYRGVGTSSNQIFGMNAANNALEAKTIQAGTNVTITNGTGTLTVNATSSTIPQNLQSTSYTCVLTDAGKHILHPSTDNNARTFTIPSNSSVAFPVGTVITFINKINTVTISITTDTLTFAGAGTTGNRTLAANGLARVIKISSTEWMIEGYGLS